ncbi:NADH-quinone oxidoreductase subunit J [candidate division GN15 bacterium]|nr:NADH-quinone oxidoreductase subunit J [candidate division GN15 bacterium]
MVTAFYIASAVAIAATIMVITRTQAVHALLYLIVSLLSVAVIFFCLGAPFVAVLEIIIYAGAIMVLFVFVMMLLNLGPESAQQERQWLNPRMYIGPAVLSLVLLIELVYMINQGLATVYSPTVVAPREVGISLFTTYVLGVELAGMLLLAGLVGAFHLGRRRERREHGTDTTTQAADTESSPNVTVGEDS